MGDKSKIEWTDATWNPIAGCSMVSAGCTNCYAMREAHRFGEMQKTGMRPGKYSGLTVVQGGRPVWNGKVRLWEPVLDQPLRWTSPRRIFVNSMSDLFHEAVPDEWIRRIFDVMRRSPKHIFQVLTKRPERMLAYCKEQAAFSERMKTIKGEFYGTLPNVWLGVSAEDQKTADHRIPLLLQTPATVRWVSLEPLLGQINLLRLNLSDQKTRWGLRRIERSALSPWETQFHKAGDPESETSPQDSVNRGTKLDWVVAGGESGPNARPCHPDWVRTLRDQCQDADVAFFFKQWGEWVAPEHCICAIHSDGPHDYISDGLQHSEGCPNAKEFVVRVGKKTAGRLLDGQIWDEYPRLQT